MPWPDNAFGITASWRVGGTRGADEAAESDFVLFCSCSKPFVGVECVFLDSESYWDSDSGSKPILESVARSRENCDISPPPPLFLRLIFVGARNIGIESGWGSARGGVVRLGERGVCVISRMIQDKKQIRSLRDCAA